MSVAGGLGWMIPRRGSRRVLGSSSLDRRPPPSVANPSNNPRPDTLPLNHRLLIAEGGEVITTWSGVPIKPIKETPAMKKNIKFTMMTYKVMKTKGMKKAKQ